jgi:YcxB-like protein
LDGLHSFSPRISIRKQFKTRAAISEEGTYDFDESQFRIARPSVQVSMPWSPIHSAVEMRDLFAIFTTKTCFYSIPKRFFTADELRSFRDLLEQALRNSGKKLVLRGSTGRSPAR